jgi:hypothetical protein
MINMDRLEFAHCFEVGEPVIQMFPNAVFTDLLLACHCPIVM